MGAFSGLLGNASEVDLKEVDEFLSPFILETEKPERAFKLIRDYIIFTNKRLIVVDKQGVTGHKVELHSIPYKNISHFSIESTGHFDLDSELKIWVKGSPTFIKKEFKKGSNLEAVQKLLASKILP